MSNYNARHKVGNPLNAPDVKENNFALWNVAIIFCTFSTAKQIKNLAS